MQMYICIFCPFAHCICIFVFVPISDRCLFNGTNSSESDVMSGEARQR